MIQGALARRRTSEKQLTTYLLRREDINLMTEDIEDTEDGDVKRELSEKRYPPVEMAEARIKHALLRYRVMVGRVTPASDKEKVCL